MRISVALKLEKIAGDLDVVRGLDAEDMRRLRKDGPKLITLLKSYMEKGADPLSKFNEDQKRLLLAYIVYTRQNITAGPGDDPNDEDAARILHNKVYDQPDKRKREKEITEDLKKQLEKSGIKLKKDKKER